MPRSYLSIICFINEIILDTTKLLPSMTLDRKKIEMLPQKFVNGKMLDNIIVITRMFLVKIK